MGRLLRLNVKLNIERYDILFNTTLENVTIKINYMYV